MVSDRVGKRWHLGASAQHPPAESSKRAADHRTYRASTGLLPVTPASSVPNE